MIQQMLAIWSLIPLPFLKPAWTSGSSWFVYCWSLAWRILSITLLMCEMSATERSVSILWHRLSFSSVQFSHSVMSDSLQTPWGTPGLPVHHQLPEFTQTHVHWVSAAIQPSHPLSSPSLPAPNPSSIRVFSSESTLHMRWPKYWSFSCSIIPSKEIPGLISFRMDWLDLKLARLQIQASALQQSLCHLGHPHSFQLRNLHFF